MLKYHLQENTKHGVSNFPVCLYKVDFKTGNIQVLPCHWHEEFEIILVVRGSATFMIDEQCIERKSGQFLFINCGQLHSAYSSDPEGCEYHALVMNYSFLNSLSNDICQSLYINPIALKQKLFINIIDHDKTLLLQISSYFNHITEKLTRKNIGYELYVKGSILMLISLLAENGCIIDNHQISTVRALKMDKIKKVIDYIAANYNDTISIDVLSKLTDLNKYNFCRFFKRYSGMTPIEYLNFYRINKACNLLENNSCSVTDAALQTGFQNMSYFAKVFKKYKNVAPSLVRK